MGFNSAFKGLKTLTGLISECFKNVTLTRKSVVPEDDLRIETYWSDFKCFNINNFMYVH